MPAHSLDFTTHAWDCERYADEIAALRPSFSEIVICVHRSCWKKGYWVEAFRSRGFPVITGASSADANALERIRVLLSTFEYVTTNAFGSHIPYAAYFGAKVSLHGTYAEVRVEDYAGESFWAPYPELLERSVRGYSLETIRGCYPELFCHPRDAVCRVAWGREMLGADNQVGPAELRRLFGWTARELVRSYGDHLATSQRMVDELKSWIGELEKARDGYCADLDSMRQEWRRCLAFIEEQKKVIAYRDGLIEQLRAALAAEQSTTAALHASLTWKAGRLVLSPRTALHWALRWARPRRAS